MALEQLQRILSATSWDFGLAKLEKPLSLDLYKNFLDKGFHGEMAYLQEQLEVKQEPKRLLPTAKSAIVVRQNYLPHPEERVLPKGLKIARYAQGEDYHFWFKQGLKDLIATLKDEFRDEEFLCFTDSSPVLERDLAYRAGLGWVGKNSCLIHPEKGSFFFIGEIYTSLDLGDYKAASIPDRCGTCRRCIEACPTSALTEERTMDATKCISYLTIEAKTSPPLELREKTASWYFGCDICQEVCPWNQKVFGREFFKPKGNQREETIETLRLILTSSNRAIERLFMGTALLRANPTAHRRNAILVAVQHELYELRPEIEALYGKYPKIDELCEWALEKLPLVKEALHQDA